MNEIDAISLITCIETSFLDNGVVFEVSEATAEEVKDEVEYNDAFKMLSKHTDLIDEDRQWIRIAYGQTFALVGAKQEDDKLEVLVDTDEDCVLEDLRQIVIEGIKDYAYDSSIEVVKINRGKRF